MATAPTGYTLVDGPSGSASYPALVYKDANGGLATITTPWYLNASGVYIPAPVDANGNPQMSITGSSTTLPVSAQPDTAQLITAIPATNLAASGNTASYILQNTQGWTNMRILLIPGGQSVQVAMWWPSSTGASQGTAIQTFTASGNTVFADIDITDLPWINLQAFNQSTTAGTTGTEVQISLGRRY